MIDLPGIYSLSPFSIEELISREYIHIERPDLVINVVDTSKITVFKSLRLAVQGASTDLLVNRLTSTQSLEST